MKNSKSIILVFILLAIVVFFKNAWVCDDSYINIRSIEQLYAGNGPVFNQGERVQIYTSPLWYWLIAATRSLYSDPFINLIGVSFICFLIILLTVGKTLSTFESMAFFACIFASNAFYDYTTSGLENILGYLFLLPLALYPKHYGPRLKMLLYISLALAPVFRHDFVTIVTIPALYLVFTETNFTFRKKVGRLFLLSLPLLLWTMFSVIYYGCPVPNTALAKLYTGLSSEELYKTGALYYYDCIFRDPASILLIILGLIAAFTSPLILNKTIGAGIFCNLIYVFLVGGDFMGGRFISYAVFLSILILVQSKFALKLIPKIPRRRTIALVIYVAYLLLFYHTPVNTWAGLKDYSMDCGVTDERAYFFEVSSMFAYINNKPEDPFPNFEWSQYGLAMKEDPDKKWIMKFIGFAGYWAGVNTIIIDPFALSDPFLSRQPMPPKTKWRIGHFERKVTKEYLETLETNKNSFTDPKEAELYDLVWQATKADKLFTKERLKAILKLNLTYYYDK